MVEITGTKQIRKNIAELRRDDLSPIMTLSVRTNPEIDAVEKLDRIVCEFSVTEDLTMRCVAKSSSVADSEVETQIFDLCFGLQLESSNPL